MMKNTFEDNLSLIKKKLAGLTAEKKYLALIEMGKNLTSFQKENMTSENLVPGCQSILYLSSTVTEGKIFFSAYSDALISKGLAALLIDAYNGLTPTEILTNPPLFLKELEIISSLSPNRSSGLFSIYQKMKEKILHHFSNTAISS